MKLYHTYSPSEGKKHYKNGITELPVIMGIENTLKGADSSLINELSNSKLWPQA